MFACAKRAFVYPGVSSQTKVQTSVGKLLKLEHHLHGVEQFTQVGGFRERHTRAPYPQVISDSVSPITNRSSDTRAKLIHLVIAQVAQRQHGDYTENEESKTYEPGARAVEEDCDQTESSTGGI